MVCLSLQAETQIGALDVDGLYNLSNWPKASLINFLRLRAALPKRAARRLHSGGQPRTWSNDGFFNQLKAPSTGGWGPLRLLKVFSNWRKVRLGPLFLGSGRPIPINRIRFYPDPNDPDAFIKAFELEVNDGEKFNNINRPEYEL